MIPRAVLATACLFLGAQGAVAQQPPPAPAFAPPNLEAKGVRSMAAGCAACHGTAGRPAPGSTLSALAGRPKQELVLAMTQFKKGERSATVMHQIAKGYGDDEVAALAEYFSMQTAAGGKR